MYIIIYMCMCMYMYVLFWELVVGCQIEGVKQFHACSLASERKYSHVSCGFGNVKSTTDKLFGGFDMAPFSFSLSMIALMKSAYVYIHVHILNMWERWSSKVLDK